MNIAVISSTSSYHHLAQLLSKESKVFHIGANPALTEQENYIPIPIEVPAARAVTNETEKILNELKSKKIDLALASGLPIPADPAMHQGLKELSIPYFFVNKDMALLEYNKFTCKKMLNALGIPTGEGRHMTGEQLFEKWNFLKVPFVVKLYLYQYGKQTIVVNKDNKDEVFLDLFSRQVGKESRITNINFNDHMVVEDLINIKKEISYHMLVNDSGWQYFGSARDYKKLHDGDQGSNSVSLGAYNILEVDPILHDYADRIYNFLRKRGLGYKGFMFLGVAYDEDDVPHILEINTRSGDPELPAMLGSVTNNLSDMFLNAATEQPIPVVTHNTKNAVTVRIINSIYDWDEPGVDLPKFNPTPDSIIHSIEGTHKFYIKHSVFTSTADTRQQASDSIYEYLNKQYLGQYRYRTDIGQLR